MGAKPRVAIIIRIAVLDAWLGRDEWARLLPQDAEHYANLMMT